MVRVATLLYLLQGDKILLILKKRGLGKGFYNGVGGKLEEGETPEKTTIRECLEEIKVKPKNLEFRGILEFYNDDKLEEIVYVFITNEYEGIPEETEEAKPFWFKIDKIPYGNMWEDDKYWLPLVLNGKKIYAKFWFENNWRKLVKYEIYELKLLNKG